MKYIHIYIQIFVRIFRQECASHAWSMVLVRVKVMGMVRGGAERKRKREKNLQIFKLTINGFDSIFPCGKHTPNNNSIGISNNKHTLPLFLLFIPMRTSTMIIFTRATLTFFIKLGFRLKIGWAEYLHYIIQYTASALLKLKGKIRRERERDRERVKYLVRTAAKDKVARNKQSLSQNLDAVERKASHRQNVATRYNTQYSEYLDSFSLVHPYEAGTLYWYHITISIRGGWSLLRCM